MTHTLARRFPGLETLPHADLLGPLPTPVEALPRLSRMTSTELFIKRDDRSAQHYGGNKARKLAYLIGEATREGADTLLTVGAFGSLDAMLAAGELDAIVVAICIACIANFGAKPAICATTLSLSSASTHSPASNPAPAPTASTDRPPPPFLPSNSRRRWLRIERRCRLWKWSFIERRWRQG